MYTCAAKCMLELKQIVPYPPVKADCPVSRKLQSVASRVQWFFLVLYLRTVYMVVRLL